MNRKLSYQQLEQRIQKIEKNLFDLKNKEKELEEHREKLQLAMKTANYFSFEINLKSLKITASEEIYQNLGYPKYEITSLIHNAGSLIHPGDYEKMKAHILSFGKNTPLTFNFEFRVKHKKPTMVLVYGYRKKYRMGQRRKSFTNIGIIKKYTARQRKSRKI
ncbi:MAG: PAS domain-containing protein [Bacteroidota bacterium]|nr:PAS domain-containing protein [Bacteroidota bacterium]